MKRTKRKSKILFAVAMILILISTMVMPAFARQIGSEPFSDENSTPLPVRYQPTSLTFGNNPYTLVVNPRSFAYCFVYGYLDINNTFSYTIPQYEGYYYSYNEGYVYGDEGTVHVEYRNVTPNDEYELYIYVVDKNNNTHVVLDLNLYASMDVTDISEDEIFIPCACTGYTPFLELNILTQTGNLWTSFYYFNNMQYTKAISNESSSTDYENGYTAGYSAGSAAGYTAGYTDGYEDGYSSGGGEFDDSGAQLIYTVVEAPFNVLRQMLNFEILGINIFGFTMTLFTIALITAVIKFIL